MPEDADRPDDSDPSSAESEREELMRLVYERPEAKKLRGTVLVLLGIFYTLFAGFVLGMLLNSANEHGLWAKLFGANEQPTLPAIDESIATFYLYGQQEDFAQAILRNTATHPSHGRALAALDFKAMGLEPSNKSIFSLSLVNLNVEHALALSRESVRVLLVDQKGQHYESRPLPKSAKGQVEAMRLRQHSPEGEIPARREANLEEARNAETFERQLWVIFDESFELSQIKSGTLQIGDKKLDLQIRSQNGGSR